MQVATAAAVRRGFCSAGAAEKRRKVVLVAAYNGAGFQGSYGVAASPASTVDKALWDAAGAAERLTHKDRERGLPAPQATQQCGVGQAAQTKG